MKCLCKANLFNKTYPEGVGQSDSPGGFLNAFKTHTKIQAEYECKTANGKQETVTGTHTSSYWSDHDHALVAWGVDVKSRYNQLLNIVKTANADWFDPMGSDVPELKEWARKNG